MHYGRRFVPSLMLYSHKKLNPKSSFWKVCRNHIILLFSKYQHSGIMKNISQTEFVTTFLVCHSMYNLGKQSIWTIELLCSFVLFCRHIWIIARETAVQDAVRGSRIYCEYFATKSTNVACLTPIPRSSSRAWGWYIEHWIHLIWFLFNKYTNYCFHTWWVFFFFFF